jgi:RNA polymerase primary sigma factor
MQTLVQANLKFVVAVCHNYVGRGLPLGDLVNEGNLGLIRAAQRFDGSRNFKFISYAVWWIRQGILTALAEQTRPLNIPTSRVENIRAISKASRKLEQDLHRVPNREELAARTGKSVETITACGQFSAPSLSLDSPFAEGGEGLGESLEDKSAAATDQAALQHLLDKKVDGMLNVLGERERAVIALYYGIGRDTGCSLSEIGLRFDLTRERIRQIRNKALQKLQRPAKIITAVPRKDSASPSSTSWPPGISARGRPSFT